MKGEVFLEFFKMVDEVFSPEMTEHLIDDAELSTNGIYTAVGTYPPADILNLVVALSKRTDAPVGDLVHAFGKYLFNSFTIRYPHFFENQSDAFEFLKGVDDYIHVEVHKLYPEASTPKITVEQSTPHSMKLEYSSQCPFAELANGLLHACIEYFQQDINIERPFTAENGQAAEFQLSKV
ncbi:MAG: heme NO-binding domain-containing protein [Sneathiellales bacterium]|nr:heme NO-binding domain-containing protein [Sneathiellales bacterium]